MRRGENFAIVYFLIFLFLAFTLHFSENPLTVDLSAKSLQSVLSWLIQRTYWECIIAIFAALVALRIERVRDPYLEIQIRESFHQDAPYQGRGRWKFFRVGVTNRPVAWYLSIFLRRDVAQQVSANIAIVKEDFELKYKGRWANTVELAWYTDKDKKSNESCIQNQ